MLVAALKREKQEGVTFSEAFRGIRNYDGLTGSISVDGDGEIRRLFEVVRFRSDGIEALAGGASSTPTFVYRGNSFVSDSIEQKEDGEPRSNYSIRPSEESRAEVSAETTEFIR